MLKGNKIPGYDKTHVSVIINLYNKLKTLLMNIFKISLAIEMFPDRMKVANFTPIFKQMNNVAFQIIDQYVFFIVLQKLWKE